LAHAQKTPTAHRGLNTAPQFTIFDFGNQDRTRASREEKRNDWPLAFFYVREIRLEARFFKCHLWPDPTTGCGAAFFELFYFAAR
jgi:hypothetical protein